MEDDETFEDYIETTVPIGQFLPLLVTAITSLLFFVPVVLLSLRPSEDIGGNDDHEEEDTTLSSVKSSLFEKLVEAESIPLSSSAPTDNSRYGGTSTGRQSDNSKVDAKASKHKRSSSVTTYRRLNTADSSPRKSISVVDSNDESELDEEGRLNALRFSDPTTSAWEKLKIVTLHNFDAQTKAMLDLGYAYLIQAIVSAASEFIQMAVVGQQLGIQALSAYVVIDLFIKLTSDAVGNVITSGNTMISQIAEAKDKNRSRKIGSYLQLSILFYVIGMIPIMIFWSYYTEDILLFLKIEPSMAEEGQRFARAYVLNILLSGTSSGFQYTLDVVGFQVESTVVTFVGEVFTTLSIVLVMCNHTMFPNMSLAGMGWAYVFVDLCYLIGILTAIYLNGWLEEYYEGFFSSPFSIFKNRTTSNSDNESGASMAAVKLMLSNTIQYAISNILYEGEWQILVLFASVLGPAEVAAWGVLGMIWNELDHIVMAISYGCEVRVAITLGKGDVKTAKMITYKAIWICCVWGIFVSVVFRLFEDQIPRLITTDPFVQEMVSFNLPMISLANIVSGIAIMAEHVLWCQNRAPLSTTIASGTSGLVTLPLAGFSSYIYHFNLIGQTAAVAIGAAAFAAMSMYAVVSSDWKQISENVLSIHDDDNSDDDDTDDEK